MVSFMNKKNLLLLFSAGAFVIVLIVLASVVRNRQDIRERAQGPDHALPTTAYRNPHFPTTNPVPSGKITITPPPEGQAYKAPNDTIPPTVTITSPHNGSQIQSNSTVTLTATASDNVGVSKVEFLVNGSVVCVIKNSPYKCIW